MSCGHHSQLCEVTGNRILPRVFRVTFRANAQRSKEVPGTGSLHFSWESSRTVTDHGHHLNFQDGIKSKTKTNLPGKQQQAQRQ